MNDPTLRPLEWVGSSREDLKKFPEEVRAQMGFALYQAQLGLKHRDAKPLAGIGTGVLEVATRFDKGTYRAMYTVGFRNAVYVLHAFQKKSKQGISTPRAAMDLVRRRLKAAEAHYQRHYERIEDSHETP
jgi:phage-related protein